MRNKGKEQAYVITNTGEGPRIGDACGRAVNMLSLQGRVIKAIGRLDNGNLCIIVEEAPPEKARWEDLFKGA